MRTGIEVGSTKEGTTLKILQSDNYEIRDTAAKKVTQEKLFFSSRK
jgi:hypothetical protein